ncbi:hypothetical protein J121_1484 [Qipengyuania citrea LAMA 915]|uniref:Uncharacterized protein n=1 Tax=Qipengyuania citrea LAMA 915 TaxID=1306953 RepID=A0A0L1KAF0_9SPHN|nr:hypothetical protein J121_1484 [Qipengyuania citrea LAMA 915]
MPACPLAPAPPPPQLFHLPQPAGMEPDPQEQADPPLFTQHLEDRRVKGAGFVDHVLVFDRGRAAILADLRQAVLELVAAVGIESAAKRVLKRVFVGPLPDRKAGRCRLVLFVPGDQPHAFVIAGRQEGRGHQHEGNAADDEGHPPLHVAQQQQRENADTDEPGACFGSDGDQQAGKDERAAEQLDPPVGREDPPVVHEPPDDRDQSDRDRRERRTFVDVRIVVHEEIQAAIAPAAKRGLETGGNDDRSGCQRDDQQREFQPQSRDQREGQEDGEHHRAPDPFPLVGRILGEVGPLQREEAPSQEGDQNALPQGEADLRFRIDQCPSCEGEHEGDEGNRQHRRKRPADLLRGQDVDIEIGEHPDEGAPEAEREQRHHEKEQRRVKHCAPFRLRAAHGGPRAGSVSPPPAPRPADPRGRGRRA